MNYFKTLILFTLLTLPTLLKAQWTVISDLTYKDITLEDVMVHGDTVIAVGFDFDAGAGTILTSFDYGQNWDTIQAWPQGFLKSAGMFDNQNGVIAGFISGGFGGGCIMRTTDGGANWFWDWCEPAGFYDAWMLNSTTGFIAGYDSSLFNDGSVYKTTDKGETWTNVSGHLPKKPFEYLQFVDENVGYGGAFLFGHRLLYRTIDGGQTWDSVDVSSTGMNDAWFFDAAHGVLLGYEGVIYHTSDSGSSWSARTNVTSGVSLQSVAFANDSLGYAFEATSINANSVRIWKTEDAGYTWAEDTVIYALGTPFQARLIGNRIYGVGTEGGVFVSEELAVEPPPTSVGVRDPQTTASHIHIAPNPTQGQIMVTANTISEIQLSDAHGRVVQTEKSMNGDRFEFSFESSLESGFYFLSVKDQNGTSTTEKVFLMR